MAEVKSATAPAEFALRANSSSVSRTPAKGTKSTPRLPPHGPWDLRPKEPVGYVISYWHYWSGTPHASSFSVNDTIYESLEEAKKVALDDALEHRNSEEELRADAEEKNKGFDHPINEDEDDYDADKKAEMESKELLVNEPHITLNPRNQFMIIDVSSSLSGGESFVVVRRLPYYWLGQLGKALIGYDQDPDRLLIEIHPIKKIVKKPQETRQKAREPA